MWDESINSVEVIHNHILRSGFVIDEICKNDDMGGTWNSYEYSKEGRIFISFGMWLYIIKDKEGKFVRNFNEY